MHDNISGGALTETTFLVLLSMFAPNHGYGIMQYIERETGGRVLLGAGTLYGTLNTLLKKEWIEPIKVEGYSNKKEYIVTDLGRQIAESEMKRIGQIIIIAKKIIGGNSPNVHGEAGI
jgi:DNA-binding PadR family transcriptional regulator